jgi:hypothetical protein
MNISLLWVLCCQVDISATARSLIHRNSSESAVSHCDRRNGWRRLSTNRVVVPSGKRIMLYVYVNIDHTWSVGSVVLTVRTIQTRQPRYCGSNPFRGKRFLSSPKHPERLCRTYYYSEEKKILSMPSFGGEVKPSVPCRRFAACKRTLNLRVSRNLGKITGQFLAHSSTFRC